MQDVSIAAPPFGRDSRPRQWLLERCASSGHSCRHYRTATPESNSPTAGAGRLAVWVPDDDLLSHGGSTLSSACCRFTVLFGMGRGGSGGLWSSGIAVASCQLTVVSNNRLGEEVKVGVECTQKHHA